ncbi:MAG: hypothetical protein U0359_31945 [Byssovorax sp.]
MSGESKVDLEKYVPTSEALKNAADEKAARERLEKALEPEAASPWVGHKGGVIDKAALPSALGPVVAPAEQAKKEAGPTGKSPAWTVLAAIVVVFFPVILVFVLFVKPPPTKVEGVVMTVAPAVGDAAAAKGASTESAPAVPPVAPVESSTGTAAPPEPPVGGTVQSGGKAASPGGKIKNETPYDAAPPHPAPPGTTGAPAVPPVPTDAPSVTPPSVPSASTQPAAVAPTASVPFLIRKREP